MNISRQVRPRALEIIVFARRRLFRILLEVVPGYCGNPILCPGHASISCPKPEDAPRPLKKLAGLELKQHDCFSFKDLRNGGYAIDSFPKVMRAVLKQGISHHDELILCSPQRDPVKESPLDAWALLFSWKQRRSL